MSPTTVTKWHKIDWAPVNLNPNGEGYVIFDRVSICFHYHTVRTKFAPHRSFHARQHAMPAIVMRNLVSLWGLFFMASSSGRERFNFKSIVSRDANSRYDDMLSRVEATGSPRILDWKSLSPGPIVSCAKAQPAKRSEMAFATRITFSATLSCISNKRHVVVVLIRFYTSPR